jgi:hypothetical protein
VIVLLLVVGFSTGIIPRNTITVFLDSMIKFLLAPSAAAWITVRNAISEFGGKPLTAVPWKTIVSTFLSICVLFVVAPTMFVALRIKVQKYRSELKRPPFGIQFLYVFAVAWGVLIPAVIIATSFASESVFSAMKKDNMIAGYKSEAIDHLSDIAYKAQQYFTVPQVKGGGGKSFLNGNRTITLNDLGFKERTALGRTILYKGDSDTTLHLLFFGNRILPKKPWDNKETDRVVEYDLVIHPSYHRFITMH